MLEIKGISKTFNVGTVNEKQALNNLSLTLNDGDFCTIIGGNGAGKSTMLNAIAGVWPVDEGQILIDGQDVTKLPEHKRAKFLGRVFQDPMNGTAHPQSGEETVPRPSVQAGSGPGDETDLQGGTSLRRPAAGADPSDGDAGAAEASSSG